MNRWLLARDIAEHVDGMSVQMARAAVDAFCDSVSAALAANETVTLSDFGTFRLRHRNVRHTYHPRTRQPIVIPAAYVPAFIPSDALRQQVQTAMLELEERNGKSDLLPTDDNPKS
jgi:nucleoid DNA-binding protein